MPSRMQTISALIAASFLHPACAASSMTSNCTVTGSLAALPEMSAQQVCDNFQRDLAQYLGEIEVPGGLAIALTLHKRGGIDARLSRTHDGEAIAYPVVSIDAIDRALQPGDLGHLAQATAQMLTDEAVAQSARHGAFPKGE